MNPWLCLAGLVIVVAVDFVTWAVCAAGARADDFEEKYCGIRRS